MLFTSSRMPQSASSATAVTNSHSVISLGREGHVAGHVLQREAHAEEVLHRAGPLGDPLHRRRRVGQREQIVEVDPAGAAPAEVVAQPGGAGALHQRLELAQVLPVEGLGAPDGERDPVLHDGEAVERAAQVVEGQAARGHEVLADDLEPVDACALTLIEDLGVVLDAQADTDPQVRGAEARRAGLGGGERLPGVHAERKGRPLRTSTRGPEKASPGMEVGERSRALPRARAQVTLQPP